MHVDPVAPVVAVDVDGVLNPDAGPDSEAMGYRPHRYDGPSPPVSTSPAPSGCTLNTVPGCRNSPTGAPSWSVARAGERLPHAGSRPAWACPTTCRSSPTATSASRGAGKGNWLGSTPGRGTARSPCSTTSTAARTPTTRYGAPPRASSPCSCRLTATPAYAGATSNRSTLDRHTADPTRPGAAQRLTTSSPRPKANAGTRPARSGPDRHPSAVVLRRRRRRTPPPRGAPS
jgi:hypothetical protein